MTTQTKHSTSYNPWESLPCHEPKPAVQQPFGMWALTGPSGQTGPLYRWAVQPEWARTHRPPEPHSHPGPGSSAACTGDGHKEAMMTRRRKRKPHALSVQSGSSSPSLTWIMLCMCGMRRSIRTSSSMTRALHTFFRTSLSSSPASANRLWTAKRERKNRQGQQKQLPNLFNRSPLT